MKQYTKKKNQPGQHEMLANLALHLRLKNIDFIV